MKLPKINEEVFIVNEKGSRVIKFYSTKRQRVVRQYKMGVAEINYDCEYLDDEADQLLSFKTGTDKNVTTINNWKNSPLNTSLIKFVGSALGKK